MATQEPPLQALTLLVDGVLTCCPPVPRPPLSLRPQSQRIGAHADGFSPLQSRRVPALSWLTTPPGGHSSAHNRRSLGGKFGGLCRKGPGAARLQQRSGVFSHRACGLLQLLGFWRQNQPPGACGGSRVPTVVLRFPTGPREPRETGLPNPSPGRAPGRGLARERQTEGVRAPFLPNLSTPLHMRLEVTA